MTRDFLQQNNVEFDEINVVESREGAKEMIEKSGQLGVPVIDANGTIVVGFDRSKIKAALGL
jgi:glutaredoxin